MTDPTAEWVLMVGDETVLPSMAAVAETLPRSPLAGRPVTAVIQLADPDDRAALDLDRRAAAALDVRWVDGAAGADLVDVVADLELPPGPGMVWGGGELGSVRRLRRLLVDDRGLDRGQLSLQAYWIDSTGEGAGA